MLTVGGDSLLQLAKLFIERKDGLPKNHSLQWGNKPGGWEQMPGQWCLKAGKRL